MAEPTDKPGTNFLRRWSQRKHAAVREVDPRPAVAGSAVPAPVPEASVAPVAVPPESVEKPAAAPLPDVATLTFESDFKPFLAADVDEGTRRAALRKLFADPHFNTMDGLDVYIDDYSKFEPVTPEVLKQLVHLRYLVDPPKTRVNAQGHVEDVPDDEPAAAEVAHPAGTPAEPAVPGPGEPAPHAEPATTPAVDPSPAEMAPDGLPRSR